MSLDWSNSADEVYLVFVNLNLTGGYYKGIACIHFACVFSVVCKSMFQLVDGRPTSRSVYLTWHVAKIRFRDVCKISDPWRTYAEVKAAWEIMCVYGRHVVFIRSRTYYLCWCCRVYRLTDKWMDFPVSVDSCTNWRIEHWYALGAAWWIPTNPTWRVHVQDLIALTHSVRSPVHSAGACNCI